MLLYFDGFDHYVSTTTDAEAALISEPWTFVTSSAATDIAAMPELGGMGLVSNTNNNTITSAQSMATLSLPAPYSTGFLGVGVHVYQTSENVRRGIIGFMSDSTHLYRVCREIGGTITVRDSTDDGSVLGTSGVVFALNTLYHIEVKLVIAGDSGGSIEVRLNGVTVLTITGLTTNGTAISRIGLCPRAAGGSSPSNIHFDNLFIYDDTGDYNNDWLGERRVYTLVPDDDTVQADWTLSGGSDGFDLINDIPSDGGTNYLESTTVDDQSDFELSDLPSTNVAPIGVMIVAQAQKTDAGDGEIQVGIVSGTEEEFSPSKVLVQGSFQHRYHIFEEDPNTEDTFSAGAVNNLKISIKRSL